MKAPRAFFLGIDGFSYRDFLRFSNQGILSNLSKFNVKKLRASLPDVSIVSWTSFFTGSTPDIHGIFGFNHMNPVTYRLYYPTFDIVKPPFIWDEVPPSLVLNMPATYPVRPIKGIIVSGFVTPDPKRGVYPSEILKLVTEMNYRFDVDPEKGKINRKLLVDEAIENLDKRIGLFWKLYNPGFNTVVFVETGWDRICHFCYDSVVFEDHLFATSIVSYIRILDEFVGAVLKLDYDSFILLSDHGFTKADIEVFVNNVLRDIGFLKASSFEELDRKDTAFSLDPGRIYIHDERFKKGGIRIEEKYKIVEELVEYLKMYEGFEAIPSWECYRDYDPFNPDMPDVMLRPKKGVVLRWWMNQRCITRKPELPGVHDFDDAVLGWIGSPIEAESIEEIYRNLYGEEHVPFIS